MQITFDPSDVDDVALVRLLIDGSNTPEQTTAAPAKATPAKKVAKPAPEPVEEDLLGGDGPTVADAVAMATGLVSGGESAKVKAALAEVGAAKVSTLTDDQVAPFIALLEA